MTHIYVIFGKMLCLNGKYGWNPVNQCGSTNGLSFKEWLRYIKTYKLVWFTLEKIDY